MVDLPGGYQFIKTLGCADYYIRTYLAKDSRGNEVVCKSHSYGMVGVWFWPDYPLWKPDKIDQKILEESSQKVITCLENFKNLLHMSPVRGVAPWLSCYDISGTFFSYRKFYRQTLKARFPVDLTEDTRGMPTLDFLKAMEDIAVGMDFLSQLDETKNSWHLSPNNLFMDGDKALLADYGLSDLRWQIIDPYNGNFYGEFPIYQFIGGLVAEFAKKTERSQFSLAMIYFQLRTNHLLFTGDTLKNIVDKFNKYLETGKIDLSPMQNLQERKIVARALSLKQHRQFASCQDFVEHLMNISLAKDSTDSQCRFTKALRKILLTT